MSNYREQNSLQNYIIKFKKCKIFTFFVILGDKLSYNCFFLTKLQHMLDLLEKQACHPNVARMSETLKYKIFIIC